MNAADGVDSGWTLETLRIHFESRIDHLADSLDERYATQTKALDAALAAQQMAMQTAFTAADRAVEAALESAEKAVAKAETAANKRFEAVNEFRGQLSDQAATLMSRAEGDVRFRALGDKLDDETGRTGSRFREIAQRLDTSAGESAGTHDSQARLYGLIGAVGGVIGIILGFVALIAVFKA